MYSEVRKKTDQLVKSCTPGMFAGRQIGLEKECLRVGLSGGISQQDHPIALGRALTHPFITTDFSEALLEMVTPPCDSATQAMSFLNSVHQFIVSRLPENEHIWNTSMPCILNAAKSVRIGEYGSSYSGQMKHAYRRGLGLRYGRRMQAIAGVHFNFSMPDAAWLLREATNAESLSQQDCTDRWDALNGTQKQSARTTGYFEMTQNLLQVGWLVPYLFGASPAICTSFLGEGEGDDLQEWNSTTRFAPFGTSLRMSNIGYRYREDQPIDLSVCHNSVDTYIKDVIAHVNSSHPAYEAMGLRDEHGKHQQLSTSRLQIENEYYSSVRPKQIAKDGELPIKALQERGIRYLELRSVDVNILEPNGLELSQVAMLEMLMMFAWLSPPQSLDAKDVQRCARNVQTVAYRGREPGLQLETSTGEIGLQQWGKSILNSIESLAQWLDKDLEEPIYVRTLQQQLDKLNDPEKTPSANILKGIKQTGSFFEHAQEWSAKHHEHFKLSPKDEAINALLESKVTESIRKQEQLEQGDTGSFDEYLAAYLDQIKHKETADV